MKFRQKMISILFVSQFPLFPSPNYAYLWPQTSFWPSTFTIRPSKKKLMFLVRISIKIIVGGRFFVIFNIFIIANWMLSLQIISLPHAKVRVLRSNINKWNVSYWFNTNLVDTCFKRRGTSYDIFQEVGHIKNVSRTQYVILMLRFVESKAFYTGL